MKAKMLCMVAALVLVFSLAAAVVSSGTSKAATLCVNPGGTGGCYGSIQAAINAANPAGGDTIIIAAGTYNEHDITINKSLTIQGAGAGSTFIDGQDISRVFYVNQSTVDMSGMTIRNGNTTGDGGGVYNEYGNVTMTGCTVSDNYAEDNGGGIYNDGTLTMTNCAISGNYNWHMDGGGIYNDGTLTMTNCTISGNYADDDGGGINNNSGNVTLTSCTISDNYAADDGGGIRNYAGGTVTMTGCTVSGNYAASNGGGIYNTASGDVTLINCTISGNTAGGNGGGIYNGYPSFLSLKNCTVSGNDAADQGGGIFNGYMSMALKCTIVYGNTASYNQNIYCLCSIPTDENMVDEPPGSATDPLLGPLRDNGGPTETHALLTGSPAIDACIIDCPPPATDQRGLPRPVDGDLDGTPYCDVGAYEKQVTVGGTIEPVDRLELLAPWLALAALIVVAITTVVFIRRRTA